MKNEDKNVIDAGATQNNENLIDSMVKADDLDPDQEKLKEMNKKLPKWSLEPPQGFLK